MICIYEGEDINCGHAECGYDDYCYRCDNNGTILICPDDMCHGLGYCIHGDGEVICPECKGNSVF